MRIKLANYVSKFMVDNGIKTLFTVTGGGAMHLNDAFGHQEGLKCYYNHHEQACSTGAEGYFRVNNEVAGVCVTTGPGGTNALTGVLNAYLDSIPMFIVSGQVKYSNTVRSTNLNLRQYGDQEFDIVRLTKYITKYSEMITDPNTIKYHLERALFLAKNGRPGPVWIDIPLNIQSSIIETDDLVDYDSSIDEYKNIVNNNDINTILNKIKIAKRPIIYVGSSVRLSGGLKLFKKLINKLNIPVVCACNAIDSIETDDPLYVGRGGSIGDRAGNFAVQNSDLIISLGCRLSLRQVGFNFETWAREAYVVMVDIDANELKKPSLHVDMPICCDVNYFMNILYKNINENNRFNNKEWLDKCLFWKNKYQVAKPENNNIEKINPYNFTYLLNRNIKNNTVIVVGNGTALVTQSQCGYIKKGVKYIMNSGSAPMGYGLPAAIGAAIANNNKETICVTGDGSIQMNIQELQTLITNNIKLKIFVINNEGYHSIRQTQNNYFNGNVVGIGLESNDLSFPNLKKISNAYGIKYCSIENGNDLNDKIINVLKKKAPFICEVFVDKTKYFEPKPSSKTLEDGSMVSAPLEDLYPFLDRDELKSNMYINMVNEK